MKWNENEMDKQKVSKISKSKKENIVIEDLVKKIRIEQPALYRHLVGLIKWSAEK